MNWTIIIIEAIVMTIAFTAMVLIPLVKNPVWWIHDYPKDINPSISIAPRGLPICNKLGAFFGSFLLCLYFCIVIVSDKYKCIKTQ